MLTSTIPFFLLGIILLFLFSVVWSVFPAGGGYSPLLLLDYDLESAIDIAYHAVLPSISLVFGSLGAWVLSMRAMMISVQGDDYILFAKSRGVSSARIFIWYCMRNALLPQFTNLALTLGTVIGGAVLVEIIFSYPGIGSILFAAIAGKDYFVIQGIVYILILSLGICLFLIDLLYPLIDPRIKYTD
jgi:peptide/nickel transport system permease protein